MAIGCEPKVQGCGVGTAGNIEKHMHLGKGCNPGFTEVASEMQETLQNEHRKMRAFGQGCGGRSANAAWGNAGTTPTYMHLDKAVGARSTNAA